MRRKVLITKKSNNVTQYTIDFFYDNKFYIGQLLHRWNVYMRSFILYRNKDFFLFNLLKTLNNLKQIMLFLVNLIVNRGKVLIVESNIKYKKSLQLYKKITRQDVSICKWIGGFMTNFKEFYFSQKNIKRNKVLKEFLYNKQSNFLKKYSRFPDVVIFFDAYFNNIAFTEVQVMGIPLIAVVNSDVNPSDINFILANKDNDFIVLFFYLSLVIESVLLAYMVERIFFFKEVKRFYFLRFLLRRKNYKYFS